MTDRDERTGDEGITLVELIIYGGLLVVVLTIVAGMLISSLRAESAVRTVTNVSVQAQSVADSIETGIRNSSAFRVTAPSSTQQFLVARVAGADATLSWTCMAWYYSASASGGTIRFHESATAIAAPNASTLATWTLLGQGVIPAAGSTIFTKNGDQLVIAFKALAGDEPPASIASSASRRAQTWESAPCF
jgi:hypothetical protein